MCASKLVLVVDHAIFAFALYAISPFYMCFERGVSQWRKVFLVKCINRRTSKLLGFERHVLVEEHEEIC
jgi:hypothetical protein